MIEISSNLLEAYRILAINDTFNMVINYIGVALVLSLIVYWLLNELSMNLKNPKMYYDYLLERRKLNLDYKIAKLKEKKR